VQAWGNRVSGAPSREEAVGALLERMIASNRARGELEQAILTSLQTYNDTVTNKMDELVQLQLPSADERKAAERVREEVLKMTEKLIREMAERIANLPKCS
jgi:hypothetical protein